jgi:orotate phosphoribosyltransferase
LSQESEQGYTPRMPNELQELAEIIRKKSLRIGDFVLSSGKKATYYLDCRLTTLDPRGALLIARLLLQRIQELNLKVDAIGGLTLGADPIAAAAAVVSELEGKPIPGFIVRKEAKGHGMQRFIEGWDGAPGSRVVIVDDVCTTGDSILRACEKAEEAGYKVAATFCVVDREEGGAATISQRYPFYPLLTAGELLRR